MEQEANEQKHIEIDFPPSHNALTQSDQYFSNCSEALAEFIDNSIQATNSTDKSRNIEVRLHVDQMKENYIIISDDGCGMNVKKIRDFATYALSQRDRGNHVEEGKSMIGKYGVGAKNAGFYLGDCISIVTKTREDEHIKEFKLDKKVLDMKNRA